MSVPAPPRRLSLLLGLLVVGGLLCAPSALAQVGNEQKVTEGVGGFAGSLAAEDAFGRSLAPLGDLDGDGTTEVAVGAFRDEVNGKAEAGSVWIVSLETDGTVSDQVQITENSGGFGGTLAAGDQFGVSVAAPGDVNGDGVEDLAVGARYDSEAGENRGAVWILLLNADGTVDGEIKIDDGDAGLQLSNGDKFGQEVASGDVDGDGATELLVGATGTNDGEGAVWILSFDDTGSVASASRIDGDSPGIALENSDDFGFSIASLGPLSSAGKPAVAVGAFRDDDGNTNAGALWIVTLNADGTVAGTQKISAAAGGFSGALALEDRFGSAAANLGDLNGNGVPDVAVGAYLDDDGSPNAGALWILYLDADGTVASHKKISATAGGFGGTLAEGDHFGISVASLGTFDADAVPDLLVGAFQDDEAATNAGAFWVLFGDPPLLPVELASFGGTQVGESAVELTWTTASETGSAGFEVQRRGPRTAAWRTVDFVESKADGGTTTRPTTYRLRAEALPVGTHQFRLRQVDLDGSAHLHEPVPVTLRMQEALHLSGPTPNPVRGQATLSFAVEEARPTRITLFNALGQRVRTVYRGVPAAGQARTARLDASSLPSGTYFLRLQAGDRTETRRVTIVR